MGSSMVLCSSAVLILLCVGLGRAEHRAKSKISYNLRVRKCDVSYTCPAEDRGEFHAIA